MRAQARPQSLPACALAAALALGLAGGAAADSGGVCVVVDPVVELGSCNTGSTTASSASARAEQPEAEPPPYRVSSTTPVFDEQRLAVTFKRGTTRATIAKTFADAGVTSERAIPALRAYMVRVEPADRDAALATLRAARAVESAGNEPLAHMLETTPNDTNWPGQTGLRVAGFPKAWDITRGSSAIVVAVVDTGVDPSQPDLRGALVPGYDFVNGDADPADDEGHGTAVAGVIAARSDNRQGVTGVCWRCSIMPVKVLDAAGVGDDTVIAAGIVWAVDHGASVVNLSLGGPGTTPDLAAALAYAVRKGAVVIAAAGNSGTTTPFYPAANKNSLSVAATTPGDLAYSWSNYGQWVDVAAPGCNLAPIRGGGVGNFCGTSSATPVVAGLVALARAVNAGASPATVMEAIERTASPAPSIVHYGRINAAEALTQVRGAPAPSSSATVVFRGVLDARHRVRTYLARVGSGTVTATLRFKGARRLSLLVGRSSSSGTNPVTVRTQSAAGSLKLAVRGRAKRARFVLTVSYSSNA